MKRILVTGGTGQVGQALSGQLHSQKGNFFFPTRTDLDLLSEASIINALRKMNPDLVLNLAAYTAVDRAEEEPELCAAINATAPAIIARETKRLGVPVIHLSTDYVFSGDLDRPYREDDPTGPINIYGQTKRAGELAIAVENPAHIIIRASWIVSPYRNNFLKTIFKLATSLDTIRIIDDQIGGPTSANDLASALLKIVDHQRSYDNLVTGIFHFSNQGEASWADLAQVALAGAVTHKDFKAKIERISTAEYPTIARRPRNSRLDTRKIANHYGIIARDWRDAIRPIVKALIRGGGS